MDDLMLRTEDCNRVLGILTRVTGCDSPEAMATALVEEAGRLIPSHACGWVEIHTGSGFSYGTMNVPVDPAVVAREMAAVLHEHPIFRAFMQTRDGRSRAISDLVSRRAYQASDLYRKFLRKYRSEDQLIAAAALEPDRLFVLTLNRDTWGFTSREKALLEALRPTVFRVYGLLRQLAEVNLARDGVRVQHQVRPALIDSLRAKGLHPREAEVAALITEGAANREIAKTLGISAGTVRKHVERVFVKLGVHSRAAATRTALALLRSPARAGERRRRAQPAARMRTRRPSSARRPSASACSASG